MGPMLVSHMPGLLRRVPLAILLVERLPTTTRVLGKQCSAGRGDAGDRLETGQHSRRDSKGSVQGKWLDSDRSRLLKQPILCIVWMLKGLGGRGSNTKVQNEEHIKNTTRISGKRDLECLSVC